MIFPMISEKVLIIADGAAFGPQMNDIYRLMQEDSAKFSLYLPESLEWLLLKADLLGQPDILEILEHPADFIESSKFFSWERFFTNLLEQRTKDVPYMLFPAYAGAILIPAECRRSCGAVVHPSTGRPGGPELIHNRHYAYILVNTNKS